MMWPNSRCFQLFCYSPAFDRAPFESKIETWNLSELLNWAQNGLDWARNLISSASLVGRARFWPKNFPYKRHCCVLFQLIVCLSSAYKINGMSFSSIIPILSREALTFCCIKVLLRRKSVCFFSRFFYPKLKTIPWSWQKNLSTACLTMIFICKGCPKVCKFVRHYSNDKCSSPQFL